MEEDAVVNPKVSGYLEKKSKMKMMNSYKRYWFVLEGRLLLYYRSKDEYEAISPCKGSINLGPACNVKTCPSTSGVYVFQIETRTTTITLRADSREDQNRWMQGIMCALKQNLNARKLSHFRYSLDELPQQTFEKGVLRRKNTIPQHLDSSKNQLSKDKAIIQRLQKIGAHSYGGSMGAINQNENICHNTRHSNSTEAMQETNLTSFGGVMLVENDQYGLINKSSRSTEKIEIRKACIKENIYERISGDSSISTNSKEDTYDILDKTNVDERLLKNNQMISTDCDIDNTENKSRPTTFLLENETYGGIQLNATKNDLEDRIRQTSFILENSHYYDVDKTIQFPNRNSEVIYAEPKCSATTDHNENNLILNNLRGEENAYSITKLYDSEKNSVDSTQYEDLEKYGDYGETQRQNENDENMTLKNNRVKKQTKNRPEDNEKQPKSKKSSNFIKRVWKKKRKQKEKEESTEELYETVPELPTGKLDLADNTAVQMLSELQNILENKMPLLLEQCSRPHNGITNNENDAKANENTNSHLDNAATVQMLAELQNILKDKKVGLTPQNNSTESPAFDPSQNRTSTENASCSSGTENMCPVSPTKHQKASTDSPNHNLPKNSQLVILPPKKRHSGNISLDKILDDLDVENSEDYNKYKVKSLIKHFSRSDTKYDVELRTNRQYNISREDVDSNELSRLLDELAKVTCAPILTPGVTFSLISSNVTDEELIKLLPTQQRRRSDPDYDIPRPHKSLINLSKAENSPENIIGSTRFFGPILKFPDNDNKKQEMNPDSFQMLSITPDSLEPELVQPEKCIPMPRLWEDDKSSYTSHHYTQLKYCNASNNRNEDSITEKNINSCENSKKRLNMMIENDIYAQPKSLHNLRLVKDDDSSKFLQDIDDSKLANENLEIFIDSLEIDNNNTSTIY